MRLLCSPEVNNSPGSSYPRGGRKVSIVRISPLSPFTTWLISSPRRGHKYLA
jgi:hypothetical protein